MAQGKTTRIATGLRSMLALAAALVPGAAMAAQEGAAQQACLSRAEAQALLTYSLPQVIDGAGQRCQASLPANAYLRAHRAELVQRYTGQKPRHWPQARNAFLKLGERADPRMGEIARQLPDKSLQPLVDATVSGLVAQTIKPDSCPQIDLAISLLAPLPPENTAGLIALFVEIAGDADELTTRQNGKSPLPGGFSICKT
ncbi:hypothetical protein I5E68_10540 [Novosphingobium sp. YJ-S2-02]|uniref:Uncharacterized protein n=1 Tax=Novosphingobium aureum TaxID=2792964 RepID=A0A931HC88_9SPHN|nr:hypothetical protein [Novosphingobium aureum]MBH0113385.1 hypothetical protein [Novosphingobium aureum]